MKCLLSFCLMLVLTAGPPALAQQAPPNVPLNMLNPTTDTTAEQPPAATPEPTPTPTPRPAQVKTRSRGTPRPTPKATPAAAEQSPAFQAAPEPTPKPTATPTPKSAARPTMDEAAPMQVTLERLRVNRTKIFKKSLAEPLRDKHGAVAAPLEADIWFPCMTMQFRLISPKDWEVTGVEEAKIVQALDQGNQPLPGLTQTGGIPQEGPGAKLSPLAPLVDLTEHGAIVLIRTEPPPPAVTAFKRLDVRFVLTVGYKQVVKIKDIHGKIGQPLLHDTKLDDVAMVVNDIEDDTVIVQALGNLNRIGAIQFEDGLGKAVEPYTQEVMVPEQDKPGEHPSKQWSFSFTQMPPKLSMNVEIYPETRKQALTVKMKVPLP